MRTFLYNITSLVLLLTKTTFTSDPFQAIKHELHSCQASKMNITIQPSKQIANVTLNNSPDTVKQQPLSNFLSLVPYIKNDSVKSAIKEVLQGKHPQQAIIINSTHIFTTYRVTHYSYQHSYPSSYQS